jgi:hypothetical protein
MLLIGRVSLDIGPPTSLISFFKHQFTCDVIIRDFHLLDFSYGDYVCESKWGKPLRIAALKQIKRKINNIDFFMRKELQHSAFH